MSCGNGSCKLTNYTWGITNGNKLHRLTFSKSLAEHIVSFDDSL